MVYHFLARRTNVRQETPLDWTKSQKKYKRRIHVKKRKDVRNKKNKICHTHHCTSQCIFYNIETAKPHGKIESQENRAY